MISFDEIMRVTSGIADESYFHPEECRAYYDLGCSLPDGSSVLEIGLFYGRSTSVIAQVAAHKKFRYVGVDPFILEHASFGYWNSMVRRCGIEPTLLRCKSSDANLDPYSPFDMALIDGDHSKEGVKIDCDLVLPRIKIGGYVLFHDWLNNGCPDVAPTASDALRDAPGKWKNIWMHWTLCAWRRDA